MNILIADGKRSELIARIFAGTGAKIYRLIKGVPETKFPGEVFSLRFRHASEYGSNDEYSNLPVAEVNICTGGYGSARQNRKNDEVVLYGSLGSDVDLTPDDALALLRYAADKTGPVPACLLPDTYNEALENELAGLHAKPVFSQSWQFPKPRTPFETRILLAWAGGGIEKIDLRENFISRIMAGSRYKLTVVSGSKEWEALNAKTTAFDLIFIGAELGWQSQYLTAFEGIDRLAELRRDGCRAPVFLCSYASWDRMQEIAKMKLKRFDILKTPGQYFLNLKTGGLPADALRELE